MKSICIIIILHSLFPIKYLKPVYKWEEKENKWFDKKIQTNFGYQYLREYKKYYKNSHEKYYNQIKYKVFLKETLLNVCLWWNKKTKINIDRIDVEKYF